MASLSRTTSSTESQSTWGIRGGVETAFALGGLQQAIEFGLDDGRNARLEGIHLRLLHIRADDVMPKLGETTCGDGPNITEAEDADVMSG